MLALKFDARLLPIVCYKWNSFIDGQRGREVDEVLHRADREIEYRITLTSRVNKNMCKVFSCKYEIEGKRKPILGRKNKVHPRTDHAGLEWAQTYSSTLSLTPALGGGGLSTPRPCRFTPGKDPVPIVQEAGWAPGQVWTGVENLAQTGMRSPDRPAHRESLYRLSYTGP